MKKKTNARLVSLSSVSLPVRLCLRVFVWVLLSGFPCVTFYVPLAYLVCPYFPACQVSLSLSCSLGFPRPFPLLSVLLSLSLALLGVSMFYSPVHMSLLCSTHSPQSVMCFMPARLVVTVMFPVLLWQSVSWVCVFSFAFFTVSGLICVSCVARVFLPSSLPFCVFRSESTSVLCHILLHGCIFLCVPPRVFSSYISESSSCF